MNAADVPTELVEKAARAKYDADPYRRPDGSPWPWEELDLADIQEIRGETRHALAAVLPEIQAQALRDAAHEGKRLPVEARALLVEFAQQRIQSVWDDAGTVDALTLAQNVVAAQEFLWISLQFPARLTATTKGPTT